MAEYTTCTKCHRVIYVDDGTVTTEGLLCCFCYEPPPEPEAVEPPAKPKKKPGGDPVEPSEATMSEDEG